MEDSADGTGLEDEEDVEKHFKSDFDETGSMTSQDDVEGRGGGGTEHSGYHSEDGSDDVENSDEVSVIEDVAAPQHTNYTADPPEVSLDIDKRTSVFNYFCVVSLRSGWRFQKKK